MSTLIDRRYGGSVRRRPSRQPGRFGVGAGCQPANAQVTLEDVIVGAWQDLVAHRAVSCLVCGASMTPRYGAGHAPVGGRCGDCGASFG